MLLLYSVVFSKQATTHNTPSLPLPLFPSHKLAEAVSAATHSKRGRKKVCGIGTSCIWEFWAQAFVFLCTGSGKFEEKPSLEHSEHYQQAQKKGGDYLWKNSLRSPTVAAQGDTASQVPVNIPWSSQKSCKDNSQVADRTTRKRESQRKKQEKEWEEWGWRRWRPCFLFCRDTQACLWSCALSCSGWSTRCYRTCLYPKWWHKMISAHGNGRISHYRWFTLLSQGRGLWPGESPHWVPIVHQ